MPETFTPAPSGFSIRYSPWNSLEVVSAVLIAVPIRARSAAWDTLEVRLDGKATFHLDGIKPEQLRHGGIAAKDIVSDMPGVGSGMDFDRSLFRLR